MEIDDLLPTNATPEIRHGCLSPSLTNSQDISSSSQLASEKISPPKNHEDQEMQDQN